MTLSTEAVNVALVERIYRDGYNRGDPTVYEECYWPDFKHHSKTIHDIDKGAAGQLQSMQRFRAAIPDVNFELLEFIAQGDKVAVRLVITGTPAGRFGDIEPDGSAMHTHAMALFRVHEGHAAEEWFFVDGGH